MYGELGKYLLEDIALYAGCEVITDNHTLRTFGTRFIGTVDKVIANKSEATLFADNETPSIRNRIAAIKDQIESEEVPAVAEKLRDRVAKLEGKIAIFKIGGATDTTKEEVEYRIEDAINSTRHAYAEGIVAGGGITLLELSKISVSDITKNALQATFQQLLINANLPAELKLHEALNAKKGYGFNLKKSDKLVDMVKEGIVDPYVVVREVITHAADMAADMVKTGMGIVFENTDKK
jgi:chaperonin GroEL